ncbi:MAG: hypothetical protein J7L10_04325 [Methanomicrobia archaeon]|nr:hypothetical protein [Methanomicrobia archaeon]
MSKVLIAYGTRFGRTEEISQEIVRILEKERIDSQLLDLQKTKLKEWLPLEGFGGVLVGSSIKIMK